MPYHSTRCSQSRCPDCRDLACHCSCHDRRCEVLNLTTGKKSYYRQPSTARSVAETVHQLGFAVQVRKDGKLWLMLGVYSDKNPGLIFSKKRYRCPA